jgi:hypothetical protein
LFNTKRLIVLFFFPRHRGKLFLLENGLFLDPFREASECCSKEVFSQLNLFFSLELRIACRVRNSDGPNDSVCTDRQGDRNNRTNLNSGEADSFDLFHHRCAATSSCPSSGGQNDTLNTVF